MKHGPGLGLIKVLISGMSLAAGNGGIARVARLSYRAFEASPQFSVSALAALDNKCDVEDLASIKCFAGSRCRYAMRNAIAAARADLVLYDSLSGGRAHLRVPFLTPEPVVWIHGIEVWETARKIRIRTARNFNRMLTNSEYTRRRAVAVYGEAQFGHARVCRLGTETDDAPKVSRLTSGENAPMVLIVARMDELAYKGHRELIDCWPSVKRSVPDAQLCIVGRGNAEATYRARVVELGLSNVIRFESFVSDERLESLFASAALFAMPSRGEGFGLVYVEAMRHGLPIVASVHDAAQEINEHQFTGLNVNLDRPGELSDAIIQLLRDHRLASTLGRQGFERWRQMYCFSAFRNRFLREIEDWV